MLCPPVVFRFNELIPGDQLETVHVERQRAQAAYELIDYYNQFSKGDTTKLDALRKEGRSGRRQVAIILRRLNTVGKEVDLPSADKVDLVLFVHIQLTRYPLRLEKILKDIARRLRRKCSTSSIAATVKVIPS